MEEKIQETLKPTQEQLVVIELAKPEDWQAYKSIWLDALDKSPEAFQSRLEKFEKRTDEEWQADLKNDKRLFIFAKTDSTVNGIQSIASAIDEQNGFWLISRVYTRPDFRGQNLSEKVLKMVLEEVKKRGGIKARLTVRNGPKQEPARDVYRRKLGFKDTTPWDESVQNSSFLEKDLSVPEKPPFLYHGTLTSSITILNPRIRHEPDDAKIPRVYASHLPAFSAAHSWDWSSNEGVNTTVEGDVVTLEIPKNLPDLEKRLNMPVYMYKVPSGSFNKTGEEGTGNTYSSAEEVKPVGNPEAFNSVIEAVEHFGGKVVFIDKK